MEQPQVYSTLSPREYDEAASRYYSQGVDGMCIVNNFLGWRTLRGLAEPAAITTRLADGTVYGQERGQKLTRR